MLEFIASFFLIVASFSVISIYMYFRLPELAIGNRSITPAVASFGLVFLLLATAGVLAFGS